MTSSRGDRWASRFKGGLFVIAVEAAIVLGVVLVGLALALLASLAS